MNWTGLVSKIRIDANFIPSIEIDKPLESSGGSEGNFIAKLLRPKVTVFVGGSPIVAAPYGEPSPMNSWIWIPLIAGIFFLFLIVLGRITR